MESQKNQKDNLKINKAKETIKKEKEKIKEEKRKINLEKKEKFYQTKLGKIIKKIFRLDIYTPDDLITLKEQIFSMFYFELMGIIICLLFLFALSGGKNFIKLYKELSKLINVYDTITTNYYGNIDKEKLVDNAIDAMLDSMEDNYTTYADEQTTDSFIENIEGSYQGIGCMISVDQNKKIYIVEIFEGGPAEKAGLKEGDIILKVDNQDYTNKNSVDLSEYVKNSKNPKVKLTIKRENEEKEITIIREKVEVPSVTSKIIEEDGKKIGYIDISIFSAVTYTQFKNKLEKIEKEKIDGLIIDVRDDTGGYLSSVTEISSMFLKKGQIIYQLEDSKKKEKIKDETKEHRTYPIAVLINTTSASASEILAAAIKESYNGIIVGTRSYGKGTVQKTKQLPDGSMIKYTIQKWLTPKGNWINEYGVEPTHPIALKIENNVDNQIDTAVKAIIEKLK